MSGTSGAGKPQGQLPARFELKLALAAAAVASTLGGWAALARSAPPAAARSTVEGIGVNAAEAVLSGLAPVPTVAAILPLQAAPPLPSLPQVPRGTDRTAGAAGGPAVGAAPVQPPPAPVAQPAPRVVAVPTPRPGTGIVAATTRSSR